MFITVKNFLDGTHHVWGQVISFIKYKNAFDYLLNSIYPLVTIEDKDNAGTSVYKQNYYTTEIESVAESKNLAQKISEANSVLEYLDKTAKTLYLKNPQFVIDYFKARKVADYEDSATLSENITNIINKVA